MDGYNETALNHEAGEYNADDRKLEIKRKLDQYFPGRFVRKDLTKTIKEGANVPVYVLEYLLGQYCNSDDPEVIEEGIENVKRILRDNYVRSDESQKILALLRDRGSYTVIDKLDVHLNIKQDRFEAEFLNLQLKGVPIHPDFVKSYDRLLCGGIWCILQLEYEFVEEDKKNAQPIRIRKLTPIQMPSVDMDELRTGRSAFTKEEWIDLLLRSMGMEPEKFSDREKWLMLIRFVPLVENNYNLVEFGGMGTGKSYVYSELSPNSILVSGGLVNTTRARLFYNISSKEAGLVPLWDCVAFDEVAGDKFKDKSLLQVMKDYMASGSFVVGTAEMNGKASMVFVGNYYKSIEEMMRTSTLFDPFPPEIAHDAALLDRIHCLLPGWEIPRHQPDYYTDDFGFITDYMAEYMRELRKESFADVPEKYFTYGASLQQRDMIAVRKTVSGLMKIIYPDGNVTKEEIAEILEIALEMRRRVKEQLKKIGGMQFFDVNFAYIDKDTYEEKYVSTKEQTSGSLIPDSVPAPGNVYAVAQNDHGMAGPYALVTQVLPGNGKFETMGIVGQTLAKQSAKAAFSYLKANGNSFSTDVSTTTKDYIVNYQDMRGIGFTSKLTLPTLISICSAATGKSTLTGLAILGEINIGGAISKVEDLAGILQVCRDSGAKKVLLPMTSAADLGTVPADLVGSFSLIFYSTAPEAVYRALGLD